jgi:hypothetical protein
MFVLTLITQLASRKIAKSTDPCTIDFWHDYIEARNCPQNRPGAQCQYDGFTYDCTLTTTSTDFNWSMTCQITAEQCNSEFSRSWFMNGPNDASAICDGSCSYHTNTSLLTSWMIAFIPLWLFLFAMLGIWIAHCRGKRAAWRARQRRVVKLPARNCADPEQPPVTQGDSHFFNNVLDSKKCQTSQAAQGATTEL